MALLKYVPEWLRFLLATLAISLTVHSFAFASNYIPSESMVPTLQIGDRLAIDKWAYGWSRYSLPIDPGFSFPTKDGRIFSHLPKRGDVVVFTNPVSGETYVKRVIGLPGDRIAMHEGRLYVNGVKAARRKTGRYSYLDPSGTPVTVTRYEETIPGGSTHTIIERTDHGFADEMAEVTVPPEDLFMMGDNRDDSADSRFPELGFVPLENLKGRADLITYSFYTCEKEPGLTCARRRYLSPIH
ncbi:MAG TPA: signal peptidase I [Rhizobiaceae bacterium]|nr:signal peptidase I [Rhizobiaceae bacterium]